MLVTISPAKRLNEAVAAPLPLTTPQFAGDADRLAGIAGQLSVAELQKLMRLSDGLSQLNAARFAGFADAQTGPAALLFAGDTYLGLDAGSLDADELAWAQEHLRILSGLYGLLRPLDAIRPYRLEMGCRLKTPQGKSLYDYWGTRIAEALTNAAHGRQTDVLVNCASVEYFSAVDPGALGLRVITPVFMEDRPAGPKIVSFFAKKARGAMARFVIQHRLTDPEGLKDFNAGGYRFRADMSDGDRLVFLRAEAMAA